MNERMSKFEAIPGSNKGYGEAIRRVTEEEPDELMPDFTISRGLESANDDSAEAAGSESKFEVEEMTPYGAKLVRVGKKEFDGTVHQVPLEEVNGFGQSSDNVETSVDVESLNLEEKNSLMKQVSEAAKEYGFNFELKGEQRKQLRAVLAALGLTVVSIDAVQNNLAKDHNYESASNSGEVFPGYNNNLILESDALSVASMGVKYNKNENVLEVNTGKQPVAVKGVKLTEVPRVSHENGRLDAFDKEIAKYNASIDSDYVDVIEEHADKPVIGAEGHTRMQYVQEEIEFAKWNAQTGEGIPPVVEEELRKILPGLCAQESRFDNGLTSKTGAKGIMQFMPETWAMYGGKPEEYTSLKKQVEIAGKFFSDLYKQVQYHVGPESLQKLRSHYVNEDSFQRDLMVPLMVNSYNVGAKRMAEAVQLYLARTPVKKMPRGKELYVAIADYAKSSNEGEYLSGYGEASREYVPKIYAQAEILNKKKKGNKRV